MFETDIIDKLKMFKTDIIDKLKMFETDIIDKLKICFMFSIFFFFENLAVYEIIWKICVRAG